MDRRTRQVVLDGAAGAVLALMVLHVVLAGRWWAWNLVSVVPPLAFLLLPLALFLVALWQRAWRVASLVLIAAALGWTQADIHLTARPGARSDGTGTITVLNWNARFWNSERDPEFYPFLRGQDADIYHLQESWDRTGVTVSIDELEAEFPGYTVVSSGDLVTLSRLRVLEHRSGAGNHYLRTDVDAAGTPISFYNVHITMQMGTDMRRIFQRRREEFRALQRDIEENSQPAVVTGDFNATTAMGVLRWLQNEFQDAADSGRSVLPRTWAFHLAPRLRLWRLDYGFIDRRLAAIAYESFPGASSDHWAQRIEIRVPNAAIPSSRQDP